MPQDYFILCLAAALAGAINAIAGGGTLLTFPALFAALGSTATAAVVANATNTVALVPAAVAALGAYRREAVTYSFLLSIPAILGGALLTYRKVEDFNWAEPLVGTLVAAVCGWWALRWLVGLVERGRLVWFALYCLLVGATVLTISL